MGAETVTFRSLIFKIKRGWGSTNGYVGVRRIELSLDGNKIYIPGYDLGVNQGAGADNFADAVEITGEKGFAETDNTGYTTEPGETGLSRWAYASAWYKWTAPSDGYVSFDTRGQNNLINAKFVIYTGDDLASLTIIEDKTSSWDESTDWAQAYFEVSAGQEYKIAIGGNSSSDTGVIPLNWSMLDVYTSIPEYYYDHTAFLSQFSKINGWTQQSWLSESGACDNDGYIVGGGYIQLVLVLPYSVTVDQIIVNNFHHNGGLTDFGVREAEIYYHEGVVSRADAENSASPIPGEKLIFSGEIPEHTAANVADDFFIDIQVQPEITAKAALGLFGGFSGDNGSVSAQVESAFALNAAFEAGKAGNRLQCGLALGAYFTGGNTLAPAKILASLGLSFSGGTEQSITSSVDGNLCLTCLARASLVPSCILKSAYRLGCKMRAVQQGDNTVEATFLLSVKANALSGMTEPCLAQEFQHLKWF